MTHADRVRMLIEDAFPEDLVEVTRDFRVVHAETGVAEQVEVAAFPTVQAAAEYAMARLAEKLSRRESASDALAA